MINNFFKIYFYLLLILTIFCCIYEIHFPNDTEESIKPLFNFSNDGFNWPVPGHYYITSYFGPRKSPTSRCIF